jgi:hypothetical protein
MTWPLCSVYSAPLTIMCACPNLTFQGTWKRREQRATAQPSLSWACAMGWCRLSHPLSRRPAMRKRPCSRCAKWTLAFAPHRPPRRRTEALRPRLSGDTDEAMCAVMTTRSS